MRQDPQREAQEPLGAVPRTFFITFNAEAGQKVFPVDQRRETMTWNHIWGARAAHEPQGRHTKDIGGRPY